MVNLLLTKFVPAYSSAQALYAQKLCAGTELKYG